MCYSVVGGTGMCSCDDRFIISIILYLFQKANFWMRFIICNKHDA